MLTPTRVPKLRLGRARVKMAACGYFHTLVLAEAGRVWAFGRGQDGRLGTGDEDDRTVPTEVEGLRGVTITFVAAGSRHSVAVSAGGGTFTWGFGVYGRLGHGDWNHQLEPREVEAGRFGGDRVVQAAAGGAHTAAVTAEGRLYTWGWVFFGQLGQGTDASIMLPTLVRAGGLEGSPVLMVACGNNHTLAVTRAGALYACGQGIFGQLGLNDRGRRYAFERVGLPVLSDARIVTASAGEYHSAAVTEDGALFTWGRGQAYVGAVGRPTGLGHGDLTERLRPTLVAPDSNGARIGRCRALAREHALAFAMVTHPRLGRAQAQAGAGAGWARRLQCLLVKAVKAAGGGGGDECVFGGLADHLVEMVVKACREWPEGAAGKEEGVVRLLGGGQMWPGKA
jgi:RCC1 and BTB domain-containing protein